jgi:hypothetical protein
MLRRIRRILGGYRRKAAKLFDDENNFIGPDGCINTAASFIAWNQVDGDYLEFGVYKGASFATAFKAIERNRAIVERAVAHTPEMKRWLAARPRYFAFDGFEGLPSGEAARQADYHPGAYACSEADFRRNIAAAGVDMSRVVTVPGFFDQSLVPEVKQRHGLRQAAMIFIDCDLYESTVPVLDFVTDLVGQGTIVVFQDWFRFKGSPLHGEQRACREWLERNPHLELIEYWREGPQAVAFLVNLREPRPAVDP